MIHHDLGLLGFILFGMQDPVFLLHLGKFQPLFLGVRFQAHLVFLEFWWQAHGTQRSGSGSAPFCSLALLFTRAHAGSSPHCHITDSSCVLPHGYGVCVLRLWISVIVCFSSKFSIWCFLIFLFLCEDCIFSFEACSRLGAEALLSWRSVSGNCSIFVASVLVFVDCLFYFSWNFPVSEFWMTLGAFVMAQTVKHLPAMQETRVQSLGWEDPLEKEMAIHSSTLAWKIPWTEEPGRL